MPSVRGAFVGALRFSDVERCALFVTSHEVYELYLGDRYRWSTQAGLLRITDRDGAVVATEDDLIGLNGEVRPSGSFCMLSSHHLFVSEVVEVIPQYFAERSPQ